MAKEREGVFYTRKKEKLPFVTEPRDFENLRELIRPHIESFNYMTDLGLKEMLSAIHPLTIFDSINNKTLKIRFGEPQLFRPQKERGSRAARDALYPFECRQAGVSYCGKFLAEVKFQYGDGVEIAEKFDFGQFPIMLKSKLCHLRDADPQTLVSFKEEASEMGGYFIMNGLERVIRLLIQPKRNHPMGMVRRTFIDKKDGFSDTAISMRCVREDSTSVTIRLHYLNNGSARLAFWMHGNEILVPVGLVLKALVDTTDYEIYSSLTCTGTLNVGERAKIILDEVRDSSLLTRMQCLEHLGREFLSNTRGMEKKSYSAVADAVLNNYILVHLSKNEDKFILLIDMLLRLFSLIDKKYLSDNPDSLQNQEVLLPGHLITIYLKEKLEDWLEKGRECLQKDVDDKSKDFEFSSAYMRKMMDKTPPKQISSAIENMLKTGRLNTKSGLDLQQRAGMTVQAERLNFLRFISHFRAVHRGASFAGLRTTSVRKLLPESWGFLCPVHTPDGEPCGLLNHMTCSCRITSHYDSLGNLRNFFELKKSILNVLVGVGMTPALPRQVHAGVPEVLSVLLDGCIVGSIPSTVAEKAVSHLRRLKLSAISGIPDDLEVGYVPLSMGGAYPGLYLFTSPSRFVRPVRNISVPAEKNDIELIGPFEQIYMEIRCADGGDGGRGNCSPATHEEIHPTGILSVVGNLTPWSNHNQSPRNMYQCQMAKQTMAFSTQALNCRADQKLYHLQTPQTPIVSTKTYDKYCIDEYPSGTNAIVAVLAYSGYDMEDAMLLNKSSVERGMFRGLIYQTESIDLAEHSGKSDQDQKKFRRCYLDKKTHSFIDSDGLPYVGQQIKQNDPYYTVYNEEAGKSKSMMLKASEPVTVDYVAVDMKNQKRLQKANIRFRRSRNPVIGDKFSSRHGQKGVCSQLWPDVDMPFSGVTGMRPDLIINPHAFPSRMTIAMLLESIAAKGGCLSGQYVDATPFSSSLKRGNGVSETECGSLVDEIGSQLASYGFNYHGSEVLYSGFYGGELTCEIFMGPVYYQRLRHMVSDKYQVRATGMVDPLTRQPLKGRKRGGGIRFGEMERDSLLAHGAAYLLNDRLHLSSDHHIADVCSTCGSILTTSLIQTPKRAVAERDGLPPAKPPKKVICIACNSTRGMETVAVPYVFRYLAAELAAMNIQVELKLSNGAGA